MASEGRETASESPAEGVGGPRRGAAARGLGAALGKRLATFAEGHAVTLATAGAVLGGLLLAYAETLDLYRIVTPSGSVSNAAGSVRTGGDQHSWAFAVMGVAGLGAALLARLTSQRLPALAAAMLGVIALVVVLALDLPDVTASGVTTDLEVGDAEPAAGFWIELVGAVVLAAGAGVLAWLIGSGDAPAGEGSGAGR
jgi:MYXO-CTERM domain-containing protein